MAAPKSAGKSSPKAGQRGQMAKGGRDSHDKDHAGKAKPSGPKDEMDDDKAGKKPRNPADPDGGKPKQAQR